MFGSKNFSEGKKLGGTIFYIILGKNDYAVKNVKSRINYTSGVDAVFQILTTRFAQNYHLLISIHARVTHLCSK